jgi:hypothetical protein
MAKRDVEKLADNELVSRGSPKGMKNYPLGNLTPIFIYYDEKWQGMRFATHSNKDTTPHIQRLMAMMVTLANAFAWPRELYSIVVPDSVHPDTMNLIHSYADLSLFMEGKTMDKTTVQEEAPAEPGVGDSEDAVCQGPLDGQVLEGQVKGSSLDFSDIAKQVSWVEGNACAMEGWYEINKRLGITSPFNEMDIHAVRAVLHTLQKLAAKPKVTTKAAPLPDTAVNPSHYKSHAVSPIDLIEDYKLGFCAGNVIKYVARSKEKNGREDLCKALWYLLKELGVPQERIVEITKEVENV